MPMVKTTENLTAFEKNLVNGFYRVHSNGRYIPNVVKKLSMAYLWILDEFSHSHHPSTTNKSHSTRCISGLNRTIVECIDHSSRGVTVFGKNVISSVNTTFHHWRFRIVHSGIRFLDDLSTSNVSSDTDLVPNSDSGDSNNNSDSDRSRTPNEYNFIVGIRAIDAVNMYGIIGSHGLKVHPTESMMIPFTAHRFCAVDDVLDMFLDLDRGELSYILNNESLGVAYSGLDITKLYRMQCAVSNKHSSLELLAFHSSSRCTLNKHHVNLKHFHYHRSQLFDYLQYTRSINNLDAKIKRFKAVIDYYGVDLYGHEVTDDYIDCLLVKGDYETIHDFLESTKLKSLSRPQRLCKVASYFYFEASHFRKALDVFRWIVQFANDSNDTNSGDKSDDDIMDTVHCDEDGIDEIIGIDESDESDDVHYHIDLGLSKGDEILINDHVIVEAAFCYEHAQQYDIALKYYTLSLHHDTLLLHSTSGRNEVLHHIGAIYFNHHHNYHAALRAFLAMDKEEIHHRDLESAIASCYDQLNQPMMALRWFSKYEDHHGDKLSVIIAIALIHFKCNQIHEADRYFQRALALDHERHDTNWMLHSKYGYYLLNGRKEYRLALDHFLKALEVATTPHQLSESYKCIGATYDKLGDMTHAIQFTKKVLEANPHDADALNNAGYFFLTMHKYETAHKHLSQSLALCPDGELTTGNIGICLYEMARYEEALPFLKMVVYDERRKVDLHHPDVGPRCLECYAMILWREEREFGESVKVFKRLLRHKEFERKQSHRKDVIYQMIGSIYLKLNDFERALKYLKKAKRASPQKMEYEQQIQRVKASMTMKIKTTTTTMKRKEDLDLSMSSVPDHSE